MPKRVDRCVRRLMADPNFKPKGKRTKKESAWALCQWLNQQGYLKDCDIDEITVEKQILSECDIGRSIVIESEIMDDEVIIWKIPI